MEEVKTEETKTETETKKVYPKVGYPSGKWKPGRISPSGNGLKKPGRKKGFVLVQPAEIKLEVGRVVNFMTFGKKKIEDPRNIKKGVSPNVPLSLEEACNEFGISLPTFWSHMKKYPEAKELYAELKENRREYLKEASEDFIQKGLTGKTDITDKERMDYSFKLLEKTDKAYQPKLEVENKSIGININKSTNDIMSELTEILGMRTN